MANIAPFKTHTPRYEAWFEKHEAAYISELLALRLCVPVCGRGLEIGVGSGRFAAPLGITIGVDPCIEMASVAVERGVEVVEGVAEKLPFVDDSFDYALVVTTICFVDSPAQMLADARRVLRPDGRLIIGFIDRESAMGREYQAHKAENIFYRDATFYSADEVERFLKAGGFVVTDWKQTLSRPLSETVSIEPAQFGRGKSAFVVVAAKNQK